jgi:hypothetical protein
VAYAFCFGNQLSFHFLSELVAERNAWKVYFGEFVVDGGLDCEGFCFVKFIGGIVVFVKFGHLSSELFLL